MTIDILRQIDDEILATNQLSMKVKVDRLLESAAPAYTGVYLDFVSATQLANTEDLKYEDLQQPLPVCIDADCECHNCECEVSRCICKGTNIPKDSMGLAYWWSKSEFNCEVAPKTSSILPLSFIEVTFGIDEDGNIRGR